MTTRVEIVNDFLALNVKPGKTIQDIVEASGSALPFGCRDGECGTCIVMIESGMEFLSEVTEKEKTVLRSIGKISKQEMEQMIVDDLPSPWRLACQMIVRDEDIRVEY